MRNEQFLEIIEQHDELDIVDTNDETRIYTIVNSNTQRWYALEKDAIPKLAVEELTKLFEGKREVQMLFGFARVVGYYSSMVNWNRSKLGEAKDRRVGTYFIPEEQKTAVGVIAAG